MNMFSSAMFEKSAILTDKALPPSQAMQGDHVVRSNSNDCTKSGRFSLSAESEEVEVLKAGQNQSLCFSWLVFFFCYF